MKTVCNEKKWLVLMTRPKAEKQVGLRLSDIDIEHFVPIQRKLRQWHDRKKWIEVPLFNSYIFVHIAEKNRNDVYGIEGIRKYLKIGDKVCTLTDAEIERVRRMCSYIGNVTIEKGILSAGDQVEILEGHFIGLKGELVTANGNKVRISITSLQCIATVEIEKNIVQKIMA